eukprot:CAMPEP_0113878852 /NCGR_PEP_ID=MMETSP0780_2-20120614/6913_1 /TAXON_ID=652834 /ORGANISM="Palpitomonas bilix" /LENGTH=285 /DNA_ID=CAMNT_0000865369 /DNA_START=102 /DNA_END=962 /DNA_ORIENTATION=+ /assembly_acc=CAM_ASM_000599
MAAYLNFSSSSPLFTLFNLTFVVASLLLLLHCPTTAAVEYVDLDGDGYADDAVFEPNEVMTEDAFEPRLDEAGRERLGFENKWVNTDEDEVLNDAYAKADIQAEAYTYFYHRMKYFETELNQPTCEGFLKHYRALPNRKFDIDDDSVVLSMCEDRRKLMKMQLRLRKYATGYYKDEEDDKTPCLDFVDDFLSEYEEYEDAEEYVWRFCVDMKKEGLKALKKLRQKTKEKLGRKEGHAYAFEMERKARKKGLWGDDMAEYTERTMARRIKPTKRTVRELDEDDYLI